jgi:hypothetical protein
VLEKGARTCVCFTEVNCSMAECCFITLINFLCMLYSTGSVTGEYFLWHDVSELFVLQCKTAIKGLVLCNVFLIFNE